MSEYCQGFTPTKMWAQVSSSTPHLLHKGLSISPTMQRCVLGALCPVRRPVAALDCILLKDSNLVLAIGLGVKISFRASEELVSWLSFESTAFWIWDRSTNYYTAILRNTVWKCVCVSAQAVKFLWMFQLQGKTSFCLPQWVQVRNTNVSVHRQVGNQTGYLLTIAS